MIIFSCGAKKYNWILTEQRGVPLKESQIQRIFIQNPRITYQVGHAPAEIVSTHLGKRVEGPFKD